MGIHAICRANQPGKRILMSKQLTINATIDKEQANKLFEILAYSEPTTIDIKFNTEGQEDLLDSVAFFTQSIINTIEKALPRFNPIELVALATLTPTETVQSWLNREQLPTLTQFKAIRNLAYHALGNTEATDLSSSILTIRNEQ